MKTIKDSNLIPEPKFVLNQIVTMDNNYIYDIVNQGHHDKLINEHYPQQSGTIAGIYFDCLNKRYFYAICPKGKDPTESGVFQYYYETDLIISSMGRIG